MENQRAIPDSEQRFVEDVRRGEIHNPKPPVEAIPDPRQTEGWGERLVPAQILRVLCVDQTLPVTALGIRLRGALIQGVLDLRWADLRCPLRLEHCRLLDPVLLADASGKELVFERCFLAHGLEADRLSLQGRLQLTRTVCDDVVSLRGARLGSDLACAGAILNKAEGTVFSAKGLQVAGDIDLSSGFAAAGMVNLEASKIVRDLNCGGGRFIRGRGIALLCDSVRIGGNAFFGTAKDEEGNPLLDAKGDPFCFEAEGEVRLVGAAVEGELNCGGGRFRNENGAALSADRASVKGSVFLDVATDGSEKAIVDAEGNPLRFEAQGGVHLSGVGIEGQLSCGGGRFRNENGPALWTEWASVKGGMFLNVATQGSGKTIVDAEGNPLRFEAEGEVRLVGAAIEGELNCGGGRFRNENGAALSADRASVKGSVFLDVATDRSEKAIVDAEGNPLRFEAQGGVHLSGVGIEGQLSCGGGRFRNENGVALDLGRSRIAGALRWDDVSISGRIDLRDSSVGVLDDRPGAWPDGGLILDGFAYRALSRDAPRDWKQRRDWLRSQSRYSSQPYRQLASVYRNEGDSRAARKILMEQFNAQLQHGSSLNRRSQAWRWLLRATVGHGYEPWRAFGFALGIWLLGWLMVQAAVGAGAMVPTRALPAAGITQTAPAGPPAQHPPEARPTDCRRRDYPCLVPALYSADLVFPIIKLDQRDNWRPTGPLSYRLIVPLAVVLGWTLTTLVVAGFTSIVRRE